MRNNPPLLGLEEEMNNCDDEDVLVYIASVENNRRSVSVVEEISKPQLLGQFSRVEKGFVGKNYTELNS